MDELRALEDKELLARISDIAGRERTVSVDLLRHLNEVDRRQLFLEIGYPSLYDYVIKELKFSEGATYRRIQAMKLLRDVPEAAEKIAKGELSICKIAKVQTATSKLTIEEKIKVLNSVEGMSARETDRELAKLNPKGSKEYSRWLNAEEVQLTFSLDRPKFAQLQELLCLRTHKDVHKTYKVLVSDLIELGQEKWNPLQRSANSTLSSHCVDPNQAWKTVTPKLRDAIWKRDAGVCTYPIPGISAPTR